MKMTQVQREIQLEDHWDVIVVGGGPAGCMAAAAAAQEGAKTLLLEATSALGGMATMGLVPNWCGLSDQKEIVHRGLLTDVLQKLHGENGLVERRPGSTVYGSIDAERLKRILDDLILESGATLRFHTMLTDVIRDENGGADTVLVANKAGLTALKAKIFIDCTGDGDLATWAGAEVMKGDTDGDMQPVTLCHCLTQVGSRGTSPADWVQQAIDNPAYPLIRDSFINTGAETQTGTHVCNSGHLWGVDNTSHESLTRAMIDGRQLAHQLQQAYAEYMPEEFGNAYLAATAPLLGVRETRRILGDYFLTKEDYLARRRFPDEITVSTFVIDIHPSLKQRALEKEGKWKWGAEFDGLRYKTGEFHGIPYRCLTPKGLRNVLTAGRCVSADRHAHSAIRVMPPCFSMGEAAGTAAAMAAKMATPDVHAVDTKALRTRLKKRGAYIPDAPNE